MSEHEHDFDVLRWLDGQLVYTQRVCHCGETDGPAMASGPARPEPSLRHRRGGYEAYRLNDGIPRHRPWGLWQDTAGTWFCACAWPVTGTSR